MRKLTKKITIKACQAGDVVSETGKKMTGEQVKLGAEASSQKSDEGKNPASWVADEDIWDKAKEAADKGNYSDDSYWAVVTHIYENMGGTVKSSDKSVSKDFIQCRASGVDINANQPWEMGKEATFCYMPSGLHTITAGFRGKAITITVSVTPDTAQTVQASFQNLISEAPKQRPFGDIEHKEEEASFHPIRFSWGDHLGEEGVLCAADPTALGVRNVNGKIHRSFSPSFATDADYSKAKFDGSVYTFPEGVRGSQSNPARITGIDFCVGTLTNKPAFRAMPPVKAKQQEPVKANEEHIYEMPAPTQDEGQQDYDDLAKCAEFKTKVAEAAEETYEDGEKHGKKFKLHNEAAMAHKAAAETCPEAEGRKAHEEAASEHEERAQSHGKIVASRKANKLTIKAAIANYENAKIKAQECCNYEEAKKTADLATKMAEAHEEIYPDGEKHGTKHEMHSIAAEAHRAAAKLAGDTHEIERHSEAMKGHTIEAERHAKVKAASKKSVGDVIKSSSFDKLKEESDKAHKDSDKANEATEKADDDDSHEAHAEAAAHHSDAKDSHQAISDKFKDEGHKEEHEQHAEKAKEHDKQADYHKGKSGGLKAKKSLSSADILASIKKPVTGASVLESIKSSKPAEKKPEAKPVKAADTKSILASLAHAKPNNK